jgi:hypothetical protein
MIFNHQQKMVNKQKKIRINEIVCFFELDLIKFIFALQQQHSTKLAQMDQIHSNELKRLEMRQQDSP